MTYNKTMKVLDKFDRFLNDREYKIIVKDNYVNIINYDEIIDFTTSLISFKHHDKLIKIEGRNLVINKMIEGEILITGIISSISIK